MMNRKILGRILASLALASLWISCATSGYNKGQFNLMTIEDERAWGEELKLQMNKELAAQGKDFSDPLVSGYVERLGHKLLAHAPEVNFDYTFTVVHTEVVNAFAAPAGHIYVHTGLIAEAASEAELAGVLAHEIGHVVARHASERFSALIAAALAGQIIVGLQEDEINRIIANLAVQLVTTGGMLAYSRANENEADRIAVEILYRAGYDPRAMVGFFERLHAREGDMSKIKVFLSTHPDPRDRGSRVTEYISALPLGDDLILDTPEFQEVKSVCRALHPEAGKS